MNEPQLNKWYYDEDNQQRFEIIDLKEDYVVVQCLDGSVSEYSIEEWEEREFVIAHAPEDWELSWEIDETLDELDDRFEVTAKRPVRVHHKEEDSEDLDDLTFSEDLEDVQDFDSH